MIQWFPGHMAKTRRLIIDSIKHSDIVIETADARLPQSSRNPIFDELIGAKKRLLVLTKEDLADKKLTDPWVKYYTSNNIKTIAVNVLKQNARGKILNAIRLEAEPVIVKRRNRGIINNTIRIMVVGIPNVGKSTLINLLSQKGVAATGDKPGVTKGKQWIRLENDIDLLDMPGMLWPKFENQEIGFKLASCGAISDNVVDLQELSIWLIEWMIMNYSGSLKCRYGASEDQKPEEILREISKRRGFLLRGGVIDTYKGAVMLLDEFRAGIIASVTMDELPKESNLTSKAEIDDGE